MAKISRFVSWTWGRISDATVAQSLMGAISVSAISSYWAFISQWGYLPIALTALGVFVAIIWLINGIVLLQSHTRQSKARSEQVDFEAIDQAWHRYDYKIISGRHYSNETVKLDGIKFFNCTFDNITFEFAGTAPIAFSGETQISNNFQIRSDNPLVMQTIK